MLLISTQYYCKSWLFGTLSREGEEEMIDSGGCRAQEDLQRGETCVLGPEQG